MVCNSCCHFSKLADLNEKRKICEIPTFDIHNGLDFIPTTIKKEKIKGKKGRSLKSTVDFIVVFGD